MKKSARKAPIDNKVQTNADVTDGRQQHAVRWDTDWKSLARQLSALLSGENDAVANAANLSALLYMSIADVNWVGVYFMRGEELVVGPFQGHPACVRIALGQGVCGTAAKEKKILKVDDVHQFDGHIACDPASRSELVVPLHRKGEIIGVLDIDSPVNSRFSASDEKGAADLAAIYCESLGD